MLGCSRPIYNVGGGGVDCQGTNGDEFPNTKLDDIDFEGVEFDSGGVAHTEPAAAPNCYNGFSTPRAGKYLVTAWIDWETSSSAISRNRDPSAAPRRKPAVPCSPSIARTPSPGPPPARPRPSSPSLPAGAIVFVQGQQNSGAAAQIRRRRLPDRLPGQLSATRVAELAELIGESECTVALTGAGVSVPSGIPDFRTPETGLWANVDPMEVAHIDVFERDPARFWSYYRPRFHSLGDKRPNAAHEALAELERRGELEGVITQNIDRLHRAAGSENVVEVHGSIATSSCMRCMASFDIEEVDALFDDEGVARCTTCTGPVKPDVVLFGELLPQSAMAMAQQLAERADLMLCVGSSLAVHPVAALPRLTLESGGRLAIVTKGPTPYDGAAELKLEGEVDAELEALLAALGEPSTG